MSRDVPSSENNEFNEKFGLGLSRTLGNLTYKLYKGFRLYTCVKVKFYFRLYLMFYYGHYFQFLYLFFSLCPMLKLRLLSTSRSYDGEKHDFEK